MTEKNKLPKGEHWVSGLSDCCDAPLKETDGVISMLLCSECGMLCNKQHTDEDYEDFPEDFFDNE